MTLFSVDIEADGAAPGLFSMTSIGIVAVREGLEDTFYRELQPLEGALHNPEAHEVSGLDWESLKTNGTHPAQAMSEMKDWLAATSKGRPVFIADNPAFDFAFVNWYCTKFLGDNPFGWSARRIGDLYCGMQMNAFARWKHLRTTRHTHNALDDALGNAGALLAMKDLGLKLPTK